MKIAHVGHTKSPGDCYRIVKVYDWCEANKIELKGEFDSIDLNKGRDFLTESNKYRAVVLHHLFRGGFGFRLIAQTCPNQLKLSPLNSWMNWRNRLVSTGAELVFAFGGMAEIGGSYIVNLPGYKEIRVEDEFWVFKKILDTQ